MWSLSGFFARPGNAIAVMGLVAVAAAVVPEASVPERVALVILAFLLMVLEVRALAIDRDRRDADHAELVNLLKARAAAQKQLVALPSGTPREMEELALSILEFLTGRQMDDFPRSLMRYAEQANIPQALSDATIVYREKYEPKVKAIRDRLASKGIVDPKLEE